MTQMKIVDGEEVPLTQEEIDAQAAQDAAWAAGQAQRDKDAANVAILLQLAPLDTFIPRGLEDTWSITGFDTTKLPQQQQVRLAQKIALRAQIKKLP